MTMDAPVDNHSRRIDDIIEVVRTITQEVDRFLAGDSKGSDPGIRMKIKSNLQQKQASALEALQHAVASQQELLDHMSTTGKQMPQRRTSDPERTKPNLRTVEDYEIIDLRRLAGITEEEAFEPERVFHMIGMMAKEAMAFSSPYHIAQRIITLAQKIKR